MKKILSLVLVLVMVLALAACGTPAAPAKPGGDGKETDAPKAGVELNVGVFYYHYADAYISTVRDNMDKQLNEAKIKFTNFDGNNNQATQLDQINTAITNGVNLLIVNIVETGSPDSAQAASKAAETAGIPIIFFNREVDSEIVKAYAKSAFVGTDAAEAGHLQGKLIGDTLVKDFDKYDLNKDGKISYVMFKGQEGNPEADFRTKYGVEDADAVLKEAGKPALEFYDSANSSKYLVDPDGAWSAKAATDYMNTILASYSEANKNMIELIIANNDNMAEGAVAALNVVGYNLGDGKSVTIPVFGVDALDTAKQKIEEGKMAGTIMQDAVGMATTIMTLVKNVAEGADLMANTDKFVVDKDVFKIRVPYGVYTAK